MGKGFEAFMARPFWKNYYDNAPSVELKQYLELVFDRSPFVPGSDYGNKELNQEYAAIARKLKKEDVEYMLAHAEGGACRSALKKWLEKFEAEKSPLGPGPDFTSFRKST